MMDMRDGETPEQYLVRKEMEMEEAHHKAAQAIADWIDARVLLAALKTYGKNET